MLVLWSAAMMLGAMGLTMLTMPKPRLPKDPPSVWRVPIPEPEPEYDPSAFWLFPDWESGPIDEPFWMRPLKGPVVRDMAEENYNGSVFYGTTFVPGNVIWHGEPKKRMRREMEYR